MQYNTNMLKLYKYFIAELAKGATYVHNFYTMLAKHCIEVSSYS